MLGVRERPPSKMPTIHGRYPLKKYFLPPHHNMFLFHLANTFQDFLYIQGVPIHLDSLRGERIALPRSHFHL